MRIKLVKDKAPFKAPIKIYTEGAIVKNPYSGETARLNALELFYFCHQNFIPYSSYVQKFIYILTILYYVLI